MKSILLIVCMLCGFSFGSQDEEIYANQIDELENNIAIGYQVGGLTLLGIDYEIRLNKVFGVHAGFGLFGYNAGFRVHTGNETHSPYFDLNFKDGGLGMIRTAALEYGGTILIKGDAGIRISGGVQIVLTYTEEFRERLLGDKDMPKAMLAIQGGWAW